MRKQEDCERKAMLDWEELVLRMVDAAVMRTLYGNLCRWWWTTENTSARGRALLKYAAARRILIKVPYYGTRLG